MSSLGNNIINERMKRFDKYLEYSGMDRKQYQYDGVKWCLQNELHPPNIYELQKQVELEVKQNEPDKKIKKIVVKNDEDAYIRGGFLVDEMGLGKTITMIGLMLCNFVKRTLIVLPPILIDQWINQIFQTTGHNPLLYHGANKKKITVEQLNNSPIVITSYGAITISKKKLDMVKTAPDLADTIITDLHKVHWSRIIFDEAHHLRNGNSRSKSVKMMNADIRWLVSGTPIQNSRRDFNNLCSVLNMPPGFYRNPDNMAILSQKYILKRTKKQVGIKIPDVFSEKQVIPWKNACEKELSEELHSWLNFEGTPNRRDNKYLCSLLYADTGPLPIYMRSRQMCILPSMMKKVIDNLKEVSDLYGMDKKNICFDTYNEALKHNSKMDAFIEKMIERKDNRNGKIVFCHFKEEIDIIQKRLWAIGISKIAIFDGRISNGERNDILTLKNDVLILQIQTGCEGLNLQDNYNEIYFISAHWNPAVEEQAIARCHRIGQKKEVFVYRFEMGGFIEDTRSLEKYVDTVQVNKKAIADEIIP
jgi:SNF2 family DNA or RNA helicase